MIETENFRRQHKEILGMASEISMRLEIDELSRSATEVRSLLSKLLGTLNAHLVMEDKALYPQLLNHADDEVKEIAKRFIEEMGGIAKAVEDYSNKWSSGLKIQKAPGTFAEETKRLFDSLSQRIEKENNELYPLIDNI